MPARTLKPSVIVDVGQLDVCGHPRVRLRDPDAGAPGRADVEGVQHPCAIERPLVIGGRVARDEAPPEEQVLEHPLRRGIPGNRLLVELAAEVGLHGDRSQEPAQLVRDREQRAIVDRAFEPRELQNVELTELRVVARFVEQREELEVVDADHLPDLLGLDGDVDLGRVLDHEAQRPRIESGDLGVRIEMSGERSQQLNAIHSWSPFPADAAGHVDGSKPMLAPRACRRRGESAPALRVDRGESGRGRHESIAPVHAGPLSVTSLSRSCNSPARAAEIGWPVASSMNNHCPAGLISRKT